MSERVEKETEKEEIDVSPSLNKETEKETLVEEKELLILRTQVAELKSQLEATKKEAILKQLPEKLREKYKKANLDTLQVIAKVVVDLEEAGAVAGTVSTNYAAISSNKKSGDKKKIVSPRFIPQERKWIMYE